MPLDKQSSEAEFNRRADRRAQEIARLGPVEKGRVEALRQEAEVQKERIRITYERQREEKEQKAREVALSGGPGWRGWTAGKNVTREEADAMAKRQVQEEHQRDLAAADERRDTRIDDILALDRVKNPGRKKERESLDVMREQKRQDRDATRGPDRERGYGRDR